MDFGRHARWILAAACIVVLWKIAVWPTKSVAAGDAIAYWIPWKHAPGFLWNPSIAGGVPRAGNPNTGGPYPLYLLFALPDALAINAWVLAHLLLGAFGMRAWARAAGQDEPGAFFAGLVYAMSAAWPARIFAGHLPLLPVFAWTPVVLACIERAATVRHAAAIAASSAMLLLGGHAQSVAFAGLLVVAVAIVRRRAVVAAGLAGGAVLAAVHLVPMIALLPELYRSGGGEPFGRAASILRGGDLLRWFLPGPDVPFSWEKAFSWGVAGTALAVFGAVVSRREPRTWAILGTSLLAFLLACGSPLYDLATSVVPFFRETRGISRILVVALLGGAFLAGRGASALPRGRAAAAGIVLVEGIVVATLWIRPANPPKYERREGAGRLHDPAADPPNAPVVAGHEIMGGYEPTALRRYVEYYYAIWDAPPWNVSVLFPHPASAVRRRHLFDLLSARPFTVPGAATGDALREERDPREWVVVPPGTPAARHPGEFAEATVVERGPGRLVVESDSPYARYLVVSEVYAEGWIAEVDGTRVKPVPAWHALMCVPLEAGRHRVEFRYSPRAFWIGLFVSLAGVLAAAYAASRR